MSSAIVLFVNIIVGLWSVFSILGDIGRYQARKRLEVWAFSPVPLFSFFLDFIAIAWWVTYFVAIRGRV